MTTNFTHSYLMAPPIHGAFVTVYTEADKNALIEHGFTEYNVQDLRAATTPPAGARDAVTDEVLGALDRMDALLDPKRKILKVDYASGTMAASRDDMELLRAFLTGKADARDDIHTCNYYCTRPACIRAQRDELVAAMEATQPAAPGMGELPELPMHKGFLLLHNTGGVSQVWGYTADQMHAYALQALAAQPAPVGNAVVTALKAAYNSGWHECARMAKRDDLHCDIDSPFVEGKRQAAIESAIAGNYEQPAPVVGDRIVLLLRGVEPNWWFIAERSKRPDVNGLPIYETLDPITRATRPAESVAQGGEWMLRLAKEIKANAEDHPGDYIAKFALAWADELAARAISSTPTPATGSGGEAVYQYRWFDRHGLHTPNPWAECTKESFNQYIAHPDFSRDHEFRVLYAHPAPAGGDAGGA